MFADDALKFGGQLRVHLMFKVVDYLSSWSQEALMSLNTDKCVVPRLHPRPARDNNVQYQLNGEHLRSVSCLQLSAHPLIALNFIQLYTFALTVSFFLCERAHYVHYANIFLIIQPRIS